MGSDKEKDAAKLTALSGQKLVVEYVKEKETGKGKDYLSVKFEGDLWANCFKPKLYDAIRDAEKRGAAVLVAFEQSGTYVNLVNVNGILADDEGNEGGDEPERTGNWSGQSPVGGPTGPTATPGKPLGTQTGALMTCPWADPAMRINLSNVAVRLTRAVTVLAVGMMAWGGAIAKDREGIKAWLRDLSAWIETGEELK